MPLLPVQWLILSKITFDDGKIGGELCNGCFLPHIVARTFVRGNLIDDAIVQSKTAIRFAFEILIDEKGVADTCPKFISVSMMGLR